MNRMDLALALNAAAEEDLLYTAEKLNYVNHMERRNTHVFRVFAAVAAAAVLLLATLGVAMAANETVRQTVFSLLHLSAHEHAPQPTEKLAAPEAVTLTGHREIENSVEIDDYLVQSPMRPVKGGVCLWDSEQMSFYALTPDGVSAVPSEHHSLSVPFHGVTFAVNYEFAVTDDGVLLNWTEDPRVDDNPYRYGWNLVQPNEHSTKVWLELPDQNRSYQMVPMLLDLETEALTDVFSGLDLTLPSSDEMTVWAYSSDLRYALLWDMSCGAWLYDLEQRTVADLSALVSATITEAKFTLQNHLQLTMLDGDSYSILQYDPAAQSSSLREYPASNARADGTWSPGLLPPLSHWWHEPYRHALMITESGGCALLELENGTMTELPDALSDYLPNVMENQAGSSLLAAKIISVPQPDGVNHRCISALAVCDLQKQTMIELDREQFETAGEFECFWLDETRFAIWAESGSNDATTLHIYHFEMEER